LAFGADIFLSPKLVDAEQMKMVELSNELAELGVPTDGGPSVSKAVLIERLNGARVAKCRVPALRSCIEAASSKLKAIASDVPEHGHLVLPVSCSVEFETVRHLAQFLCIGEAELADLDTAIELLHLGTDLDTEGVAQAASAFVIPKLKDASEHQLLQALVAGHTIPALCDEAVTCLLPQRRRMDSVHMIDTSGLSAAALAKLLASVLADMLVQQEAVVQHLQGETQPNLKVGSAQCVQSELAVTPAVEIHTLPVTCQSAEMTKVLFHSEGMQAWGDNKSWLIWRPSRSATFSKKARYI